MATLNSRRVRPVDIPVGEEEKVAYVRMERIGRATLTPTGLRTGVRVTLPTGFGFRFDTNGHFLNSRIISTTSCLMSTCTPPPI